VTAEEELALVESAIDLSEKMETLARQHSDKPIHCLMAALILVKGVGAMYGADMMKAAIDLVSNKMIDRNVHPNDLTNMPSFKAD
jgi:hypothetical protein